MHGVLWLRTHILERTEWIGTPENNQSMAMHDPKIPVVTETIPNSEVKVYDEEEFLALDDNTKRSMNLPFRNLTSVFEKLNTVGAIKSDLNKADELSLTNLINHLSTCSRFKGGKYEDIVTQVEEVNTHYHTKTCRKKFTKCRFNFKKFPSCRTIIARPLKVEGDEGAEIMKERSDVLEKVKLVMEDDEKMKAIDESNPLNDGITREEYEKRRKERIEAMLEEAEVSLTEYESALAISPRGLEVVMQRDINEMMVNNYNPLWMKALNANHDIKLCPDVFGVVTYVTDYYSKDESGLQTVLTAAVKMCDSNDIKVKMRNVANTFLTHRSMGECEAVYKLVPNMNMSRSNIGTVWLTTGRTQGRNKRMRQKKQEYKDERDYVKVEGREGEWYEQRDLISQYERRPKLENICLAQFVRMYRGLQVQKYEGADEGEVDASVAKNTAMKYEHYYKEMLCGVEDCSQCEGSKQGEDLPNKITLVGSGPGETNKMARRKIPATLRYYKGNKEGPKYAYQELQMYVPFRNEAKELGELTD